MTPVKFEFLGPDGQPIANQAFEIKLPKSGFMLAVDGIVMPDTLTPTTDVDGTVTIPLMPSSTPYYLKMLSPAADVGEDCCQPGIFYKFYVPVLTPPVTEVRFQDVVIDPPPSTRAYDEAALLIIIDSKVHAMASAAAALVSELASKDSEDNAKLSEDAAKASELVSIDKAQQAGASQLAAKDSEDAAKVSEDNAKVSELAAEAAADFAEGAVVDMQAQVDEATLQAGLSATSAGQSATSAGASATSAADAEADRVITEANVITTTTNKDLTAADVVTITNLKVDVIGLKDETEGYRDEALAAVGTLGAVIQDGGPIDLSGGVYPAKPTHSTMWKVQVGGTVPDPQGDTYGAGDTLFYAKDQDLFYKIDNTENVSSVAGKTGVVTLDKVDVGLPLVDNTADSTKPVSTPQQAALDLKVNVADIIDTLASTDPTKPLSAKQGKTLYDLVQANNVTLVVFEYLATAGQTVFSGVDTNGLTLLYTVGTGTIALRNGVQLDRGDDYTAINGNSITINLALDVNDLIQVMAFGTFSVANHYTKPEDDALLLAKANKASTDAGFADRYTKAEDDALLLAKVDKTAIIDVAHGGTGKTTEFRKGFISGLRMVYIGRQALTITAGAAYVNSLGRIIELAADKVLTGLTFTTNTVHHVYLYENVGVADIEISTAAPVSYYGSAYGKTADTSRRYIGSFLATTTTAMMGFFHDIQTNRITFIDGQPGTAPFALWTGFTSNTPILVSAQLTPLIPLATAVKLTVSHQGGGSLVCSPADQITNVGVGGSNWTDSQGYPGQFDVTLARSGANTGKFYTWVSAGGNCQGYATGYIFER